MLCPECDVKMIDASYFYPDIEKYKTGNWSQEDLIHKQEKHLCLTCGIQYTDNWIIPAYLKISEKQHKAIWSCYNGLDIPISEKPITRSKAIKFLNKYLPQLSEAKANGVMGSYETEVERQREEARLEYEASN